MPKRHKHESRNTEQEFLNTYQEIESLKKLVAIQDDQITRLQNDSGKISVSADDVTKDFLIDKVEEGPGMKLAEVNDGAIESMVIDASVISFFHGSGF